METIIFEIGLLYYGIVRKIAFAYDLDVEESSGFLSRIFKISGNENNVRLFQDHMKGMSGNENNNL